MDRSIASISSTSNNVRQDVFPLNQWTITTRSGVIMQSKCTCSKNLVQTHEKPEKLCTICQYQAQLPQLYTMPDMVFNENILRLEHVTGIGIEFNALDALRRVEETKDPLRVALADGWQSARADFPFAKSITKPFDWTFTTDYRGTLLEVAKQNLRSKQRSRQVSSLSNADIDAPQAASSSNNPEPMCKEKSPDTRDELNKETIAAPQTQNPTSIQPEKISLLTEETFERIDVNKLTVKEEILFYDDVTLFEDELADHGTASYSVKVRVMPHSLFILARFYLRVDGVLARINDTRIYHELGKRYMLREYTNREAKLSSLDLPISTVINPNELMHHLPIIQSKYEKLTVPRMM